MAESKGVSSLRWMALVALSEATFPAASAVAEQHTATYPAAPPLKASTEDERLQVFSSDQRTLAITLVAEPIPWSHLEAACDVAWHWPDAARRLRSHQAHLVLFLVDEPGSNADHALALTRFAASVVAAAEGNALGVVWGPARMVHAPAAFLDQARQAARDDLPLFLWVDFRIEPIGDSGLRLYTNGLESLGAAELEMPRFTGTAQELLECAYNVAHYQLTPGKRINDGDTLGVSERRCATARRSKSILGGGDLEVIWLEFAD